MSTILQLYNFSLNCIDEECEKITINLNLTLHDNGKWSATIRDSKGRLFEITTYDNKYNCYTFNDYLESAKNESLNIVYDIFEDYITVFLKGGDFCDQANGLYQIK